MFLTSCNCDYVKPKKAYKGVIDLSNWDFDKNYKVELEGEWEFYWHKHLKPNDSSLQKKYIYVPKSWSAGVPLLNQYSEFGYATYRLRILLPNNNKAYCLIPKIIYTSSEIFANGELIAKQGIIGVDKEKTKPGKIDLLALYQRKMYPNKNQIDLLIYVSDFQAGEKLAGLSTSIYIAEAEVAWNNILIQKLFEAFLIGILILAALYHLFLFFFRKKDYSTLVFAILVIVTILRALYTSEFFSWYFNFSFYFYPRIIYLPIVLINFLMYLFFCILFAKEFKKFIGVILACISSVFIIIYTFGNYHLIHKTDWYLGIVIAVTISYLFYISILSVIKKYQGAIWAFMGMLFFVFSVVNDVFYALKIINSIYLTSYGMIIYVIFQSLNIADRFSKAFRRSELLAEELDYKNINLEKIVYQRTEEIRQQNEEILTQRDELQAQNQQIIEQKRIIEKKNLNITASIRYAGRIQNAILPKTKILSEHFPESFIFYKPRDIVSGDFYFIKRIKQYFLIAAADCTGHGVPGAFMSVLSVALLNDIVRHTEIDTSAKVLEELRKQIKISLQQTGKDDETEDGLDIAFCAINLDTMQMQFAGANSPLWLVKSENQKMNYEKSDNLKHSTFHVSLLTFHSDMQPIGIYPKEKPFTNHEIQLEKGDRFYIFTDGYESQFGGEKDEKLNSKRFQEIIMRHAHEIMYEQGKALEYEFDLWRSASDQIDDVLIIGVEI